jgi:ubiquinone/menaquinone biosynthesis C-methylase UbiE
MSKLASFLKRWPALYHFAEASYWRTRGLKADLLGTKVQERYWASRHCRKGSDWSNWNTAQYLEEDNEWVIGYWDSQNHPHRPFLINRISNFSSNTILEIGCNCGPNLRLLAKKFPRAVIMGIDINPLAVEKGNEWLAQEGISNVKLSVGKADELGDFQDTSFDVVFTDAVLMYIGPDKIKNVIKEMIRVTRLALILLEWHDFDSDHRDQGLGVYYRGAWRRDYVALLKQFVREEQIHVTKITEEIWPEKNWKEVGAIIEVIKR